MSTFDSNLIPPEPGPEPPGDWQTPYPSQAGPTGEKAAAYVWVCAGVLLLMSGCCGVSGIMLSLMDTSQIIDQMPADIPLDENMRRALPMVGPAMAIGSLVLLFIPCVVLTILAFKIRSGGRTSTIIALVLMGILSGVFALTLLNYLIALVQFPQAGILLVVVIVGFVTGLFVKTIFELINVLRAGGQANNTHGW